MNWSRTLRYAALVILVSSVWGCSKPNGPVEKSSAEQSSAEQSTAAALSDNAETETLTSPAQFPTTPAALTDMDSTSDTQPSDELVDPSISESPVAQVSATQLQSSPAVEPPAVEPPALEPPATTPPTQTELSKKVGPVRLGETAAADAGATGPAQASQTPGQGVAGHGVTGHGVTGHGVTGHGATEREPLFVDWPKPQVAMLFTGRQYGYLEPCGCSGLENQNGGLVRRSTLIKQLTGKGWPLIPIDAGNQVRRFGRQAEIKFQITVEGLRTMGYQVIGFGPDDLRLPGPELVGVIAPTGDEPSLFVAANVEVFDPSFTSPFRVIEKGGKKIGITAVLGERNQKMIHNDDVNLQPAETGLKRIWPQLQQAKCDLYVLIAHATTEESIALGKAFPQFKLVITTGGAGEPTRAPEKIKDTDSLLVEVGTKGMFAGVVALFDDPANPLRYQRIPLDSRFPDSKEMLQLLAAYQDQLKAAGFEGLGIRPQPIASGLEFVGSQACAECHEDEYKIWSQGLQGEAAKHSHAYATLQRPPNSRGSIPRNFDPECISCHVVGWNPQKYFPYNSGFLNLEKTPDLAGVGCENCHGPGSRHVAAENGDLDIDDDQIDAIRDQVWLDVKDAEQKCLECHDLDNSPAFQEQGAFDRYWKKIEH